MFEVSSDFLNAGVRGDWIRLRTLILLRWLAIVGQTISVVVAYYWLELNLPIRIMSLVILTSVVFNLFVMARNPRTQRVREGNAASALFFDLIQLIFLLFLTGGLGNPFCFLVLAPITISATALSLPSTALLGFATLLMITGLAFFHIPLETWDGEVVAPPRIFIFGTWVSLVVGCLFVASYARRVTLEIFSMSQGLNATQMALAREQKLTDIGGVVAATAHELGTPLATIKLVSSELEEELQDEPELLEDVRLIRSQAERCRDILRDMGRSGRDDRLMRIAPIVAVVEEAAEPHMDRGKDVRIQIGGAEMSEFPPQPQIQRKPEIIHGLRNLVQNAVDFARTTVWVDVDWGDGRISVTITDDGIGFDAETLTRVGDPFLRRRRSKSRRNRERPGYEGMGLGLFIAKTLLERSGARLTIENAPRQVEKPIGNAGGTVRPSGAMIHVVWESRDIEVEEKTIRQPLGRNELNIP